MHGLFINICPLTTLATGFIGGLDGFGQCLQADNKSTSVTVPSGSWTVEFMVFNGSGTSIPLTMPYGYTETNASASWKGTTVHCSASGFSSGYPSDSSFYKAATKYYYDQTTYTSDSLVLSGLDSTRKLFTSSIPTGQWNYVAYVYDSDSKTVRYYLNGILITTQVIDVFSETKTVSHCQRERYFNFSVRSNFEPANSSPVFYETPHLCDVNAFKLEVDSGNFTCEDGIGDCTSGTIYSTSTVSASYTYSKNYSLSDKISLNGSCLDEVRVSNKALYSGNSYTYRTSPFDTNFVNVLPENPVENDVVIYGNVSVTDVRFGGVRPTYPTLGNVWFSLNSSQVIQTVQLYNGSTWVDVDARLYNGTEWVDVKGYDSKGISVGVPDSGSGGDSGSDSGSDSGGDSGGSSGGSSWSGLGETIGNFIKAIVQVLAGVLDGLVSGLTKLVGSIGNIFTKAFEMSSGVTDFFSAALAWIPSEIVTLICLGISLAIILMLIKFFRG